MLAMTTSPRPTSDTRLDGRLENALSATILRSVGFPYANSYFFFQNNLHKTTFLCVY
jgi:hypothetical protein